MRQLVSWECMVAEIVVVERLPPSLLPYDFPLLFCPHICQSLGQSHREKEQELCTLLSLPHPYLSASRGGLGGHIVRMSSPC